MIEVWADGRFAARHSGKRSESLIKGKRLHAGNTEYLRLDFSSCWCRRIRTLSSCGHCDRVLPFFVAFLFLFHLHDVTMTIKWMNERMTEAPALKKKNLNRPARAIRWGAAAGTSSCRHTVRLLNTVSFQSSNTVNFIFSVSMVTVRVGEQRRLDPSCAKNNGEGRVLRLPQWEKIPSLYVYCCFSGWKRLMKMKKGERVGEKLLQERFKPNTTSEGNLKTTNYRFRAE